MKTKERIFLEKKWLENALLEEIEFCGETTIHIKKEEIKNVLKHFKEEINPSYDVLMDLTAVHYLLPHNSIKMIYFLHSMENGERLRVSTFLLPEEEIDSVIDLWEGAAWYEREIYDLFGVHFKGHHDLKRLLMPDDWIGHPLRKDYPLTQEPVEFKHEAKPKVPSEIIHVRWDQKYHS
jgi:NADH-quinone oxidoreductase subunit C